MGLPSLLKRFRNKWRTIWESFWTEAPDPTSLPPVVAADEPISRFLLHSRGYFSAENRRVKRRAFMPDPKDKETSCYRTQGMSAYQIWEHCRKYVMERFHGRAEIVAAEITNVGPLQLRPDNDPPRHVSITNWSGEEEEWASWAQVLADRATLHLPTD